MATKLKPGKKLIKNQLLLLLSVKEIRVKWNHIEKYQPSQFKWTTTKKKIGSERDSNHIWAKMSKKSQRSDATLYSFSFASAWELKPHKYIEQNMNQPNSQH